VLDLGNRTVISGLNDSQMHPIRGGLNYNHFGIRSAKNHDLFIDPTDVNRPFPNRNGLDE
jgi:predicted amidohydrolase YtcJ